MRIAIIGGGILGSSIAWHVARDGAQVTVFDDGSSSATAGSFAWINASWGNSASYRRLRMASMAAWARLDQEVPGLGFASSGALIWDLPEDELRLFAREAAAQGYRLRACDADDARQLEPRLRQAPGYALFAPDEGMVEASAARDALLRASGAVVRTETASLTGNKGEVRTSQGLESFDAIVVAAGIGSAGLLAQIGLTLKMDAPAGLIAWSKPIETRLKTMVLTPDLHMRQCADGRLSVGEDFAGNDPQDRAEDVSSDMLRRAGEILDLGVPLVLDEWRLTPRPTPGDGLPALGRIGPDGPLLALTHSGVTLAPIVGEIIAQELRMGTPDPRAALYRPERLLQRS